MLSRRVPASRFAYLRQRNAEARPVFLDDHDLAPRDGAPVYNDVHGIADAVIKRNDGAASKLQKTRNRQARRPDDNLDDHWYLQNRIDPVRRRSVRRR